VILDVSRSSLLEYPSHGAFAEASGSTALMDEGLVHGGIRPYNGSRWGDYGGAATDGTSLWFAGEYSDASAIQPSSWGTGIAQLTFTTLQLDKTSIGFGKQTLGTTSSAQAITVSNTGTVATDVSASLNSGDTTQFHVVDNGCTPRTTLAPAASCTAHFTFNPTTAGDKQARFNITANNISPTDAVLTGTGVGAACASTAVSTDVISPQNVGAHVTLSASSGGCPDASPLYRFYLRDTSAVWHVVQDFSTSSSFVWDTSVYPAGTYLTGVWVKDANSANTYDAYAFGTFTLGLPKCSSTGLSSDIGSPQASGTTITFTATSIGCPNPLYQWWVRDAAGNWNIAVPFAAGNTFAWNTSNLTDGTYQIGVWARQQFSANSYDAFAFVTFTLTVSHCSSVGLSTAPTSPLATGATVTLTANALGCPGAQYRFYVRDVAGTWHIVQDFSPATTYAWNTSSPVSTSNPGTYLLGVWAIQPGSQNSYDAFFFLTFSLTSAPACTVNIKVDKTSPQDLGTTAVWTATPGSNCNTSGIQYQFWVSPPGKPWAIVQPFGAGATYAWTGATAGTYQVGVWVKQAGSTASYDNFAFTTFTLSPTTSPNVCTLVNAHALPISPSQVGTGVTLSADGVAGCTAPQYQFWIRDPAAVWHIAQPYSTGSSFAWNTALQSAGTYLVGVWVRQTGASASYEAYSFVTYTLTMPPAQMCSSVNIAPSVPSPRNTGTQITFTATANDCSTADFRFFVAPPGAAFAEVQPFGSSNTFAWITNSLAPGPYQIGVWARQHGSTASYEAFAFITFQLQPNGTPCGLLTLTAPSQVIHSNSGPPFIITASASGCTTPLYQYYVRTPGGSYVLFQPYSGATTFQYPPIPTNTNTPVFSPGGYSILAMARDQSSSAAYDSFAVIDFLFDA
jgi:hypothetical protein